jgi:magnesium chelatase family protein
MSLAAVYSRGLLGITAPLVRVEAHLQNGLPKFQLVGLPEMAVKESRERVRSALLSLGFQFPSRRITVNLAPADLPKSGSRFDLPIALSILAAAGMIPATKLEHFECLGELALSGQIQPVPGLCIAMLANRHSKRELLLPYVAGGLPCLPGKRPWQAKHLADIVDYFIEDRPLERMQAAEKPLQRRQQSGYLLSQVKGQEMAKQALALAAAGGHHMLMVGPPGTGKTLLARCLPELLPKMSEAEEAQLLMIADLAQQESALGGLRPFRAPHHGISEAALIGGGQILRAGEITLAHGGVLFLDELAEFSAKVLNSLREPLEEGEIRIGRTQYRTTLPAKFQLIAAMNPCPCGYAGSSYPSCVCHPAQRQKYIHRISGPFLDRIDLQVAVDWVPPKDLLAAERSNITKESASLVQRVHKLRSLQFKRQGCLNQALQGSELLLRVNLDQAGRLWVETAAQHHGFSARAVHRLLRVARTIADWEAAKSVVKEHLQQALQYRLSWEVKGS